MALGQKRCQIYWSASIELVCPSLPPRCHGGSDWVLLRDTEHANKQPFRKQSKELKLQDANEARCCPNSGELMVGLCTE